MKIRFLRLFRKVLFLSIFISPLFPAVNYAKDLPIPGSTASKTGDRFYLDFKGTKLMNVLTVLSELTGINFVAGKEIADRQVNMILDNVTLQDALEAISRGTNVVYDFLSDRNIYLFRASADGENLPPLVTRVFHLYYVMVSPIREIESGEGGGSSTANTFSNLTETEKTAEESSAIVVAIKNILSDRGRVNIDDRSNSLIVTDTEDRLHTIEEVIAQLDRKLDQLLIEVVIIETAEDLDRFMGIEWGTGTEGTMGVLTGGVSTTRFPFNNQPFGIHLTDKKQSTAEQNLYVPVDINLPALAGTKNFSSLTATLKALQSASKIKVIAKPRILVLDNQPALIKITTNAAIGTNDVAQSTGQVSNSTTTTERSETGTSLRLTPHINTDGRITLTVEPKYVTLAASTIQPTKGDPTIRAARTTLMVKHGETIVLGGLLSSQQTNINRKVPVLGDIPGIGEMFTKRSKSIDDRELILFITPHIIKDTAELQPPSIPDDRDHFDDAKSPFWKFTRKEWYRDLIKEDPTETAVEVSGAGKGARNHLMDSALKDMAAKDASAARTLAQIASKPVLPDMKSAAVNPRDLEVLEKELKRL